MLRVELRTQILRLRTLIALGCVAAVPVAAGLATATSAGHRYNNQDGLFGASTYSALNHAMASLQFTGPLLLPIVVATLAAAIASADRDWGILRYLYVAPVTRTRLLIGKLTAVTIAAVTAVGGNVLAGVLTGLAVFGWHPFHIIDAPDLPTAAALGRALAATAYLTLCMLSIAAIAFALGVLLPRGAEAVAITIGFLVAASILNGQADPDGGVLHTIAVALPVHYWQSWPQLLERAGSPDVTSLPSMATGAVAQVATIAVSVALAVLVLRHRDPAA
ncbi:ABC transporter permease [Dactylosporangium vinaceum]|uniref:ABC transporter permease n=1 Tax=Dactylosporangium vinaceum TaxID=53362 RepID=A0ABV5M2B2_9ACTN|nr:ABC transporter permease [Dactylosporangium vinaceum]UAB96230.1 ABC transporter permease [Dactylosporangium vinaceum]